MCIGQFLPKVLSTYQINFNFSPESYLNIVFELRSKLFFVQRLAFNLNSNVQIAINTRGSAIRCLYPCFGLGIVLPWSCIFHIEQVTHGSQQTTTPEQCRPGSLQDHRFSVMVGSKGYCIEYSQLSENTLFRYARFKRTGSDCY